MSRNTGAVRAERSSQSGGQFNLSSFRERNGVSLHEIAEKTKISLRFLLAIESAEYEKLPGGIFNTSYLRQYAAAVGYSEAALLEHYERATKPCTEPGERRHSVLRRWLGTGGSE